MTVINIILVVLNIIIFSLNVFFSVKAISLYRMAKKIGNVTYIIYKGKVR